MVSIDSDDYRATDTHRLETEQATTKVAQSDPDGFTDGFNGKDVKPGTQTYTFMHEETADRKSQVFLALASSSNPMAVSSEQRWTPSAVTSRSQLTEGLMSTGASEGSSSQ